MAADNPHKGHRSRLKGEFLARGLVGMPDHKALELLLCYAIPQGDVNPLAHRLMDTFGSLSGVFNATPEQLMAVKGVGEHAACLIKLIPALGGRYQADRSHLGDILDSTERLGEYLTSEFFGQRNEITVVLCLDAKCKVLQCQQLAEGTADSTSLSLRKMMEVALACNASQVVLAHNHISNIAAPSQEDILATKMAYDAFQQIDILLRDHLIFAFDDFVSLRDSGIFERFS
ncbi:MAG: RadC family protein [Oscillospiraceae bacterium]